MLLATQLQAPGFAGALTKKTPALEPKAGVLAIEVTIWAESTATAA